MQFEEADNQPRGSHGLIDHCTALLGGSWSGSQFQKKKCFAQQQLHLSSHFAQEYGAKLELQLLEIVSSSGQHLAKVEAWIYSCEFSTGTTEELSLVSDSSVG